MKKVKKGNHGLIWGKYLTKYLIIVFLVILCCIPFGLNAYNRIEEYTLSVNDRKLEIGVRQLDNDIEKMKIIASMLGEESSFLELQRINGEIPMEKFLYMGEAKERLMEISYIYDFAENIFCIYRDSEIFVSNNHVAEYYSTYYENFLKVDDLDSGEFRELLFEERKGGGWLVTENFSYYSSNLVRQTELQNAVLYLQSIGTENYWSSQKSVIAFVIDPQKFIDFFLDENIQDQASLLVLDGSGKEIVAHGKDIGALRENSTKAEFEEEGRKFQVRRSVTAQSGLEIIVCFPEESVYEQMYEMRNIFFFYIVFGCSLAILLTVTSAYIWYRPFGRMLEEVSEISGKEMEGKNEYEYVKKSILKLVSDKNEMETKMLLVNVEKQAVMLEKVFASGFADSESREWFVQQFPFVCKGYFMVQIWVSQLRTGVDIQKSLLDVTEIFEEEGCRYIQIYPQNNMTVLMVADEDNKGEKWIGDVLRNACSEVTKDYEIQFVAGISERQDTLENIDTAFAQAKQVVNVYKETTGNAVENYQRMYDSAVNYFCMEMVEKLHEFVKRGNEEAVEGCFMLMRQEIRSQYEKYSLWKCEIYYVVNFVFQSVCQQKGLEIDVNECSYTELQNMTMLQCLDKLEKNAIRICSEIEQRKDEKNFVVRKRVMEYMQNNFKRAELTVDLAARETDVSEKYMYSVIKEETGKTFSGYLDELRVAYARECLTKTDWSNEKIANESGFGAVNSFYRVFKKYTGYSPGTYRKEK